MRTDYRRVKIGCYISNISGALVCNISALLFVTFRSMYGISYSLLGLLVLINFCTQLTIDLIFSFFSHRFDIPKTVKIMPLITLVGLLIYALSPIIFPNCIYLGLVLGTILYSVSCGLGEVLLSPIVAAIPSENPDREMSKLHSVYAWGVAAAVVFSALFLHIFKTENWQWLVILFTVVPLIDAIVYWNAEFPDVKKSKSQADTMAYLKKGGVWLMVFAIFFGGAAEVTMSQWCSSYLEKALNIPKVFGDVFGMALFGITLGFGRSLYAKIGKDISRALFWGAIGATICYFTAAITTNAVIGLIACAFTGFCVSMMWPGSLISASDRYPDGGVLIFAMMAAGGDFGASAGPQLVGVVTDICMNNTAVINLAVSLGLSAEQIGMKAGMLTGMLFPLIGIFVYLAIRRQRKG